MTWEEVLHHALCIAALIETRRKFFGKFNRLGIPANEDW